MKIVLKIALAGATARLIDRAEPVPNATAEGTVAVGGGGNYPVGRHSQGIDGTCSRIKFDP
jgi:hypothetical protein